MPRKIAARFCARLTLRTAVRAAFVGLFLSFAFGCSSQSNRRDRSAAVPPPAVVVAPVVQKTVSIYREYVGRTVADYTVDVHPQVAGILETAPFAEGQAVKKGQVLFTIEPSEYKAALQSAQAQLAKAGADVAQANQGHCAGECGASPCGRAGIARSAQ